ncbi:Cullin repeat-like-containing domain protein [Suillus placidus]|uniref:Exocyst complex protein EXO70 n=1 Tax=Suillus placidus TaxID=48579 RepID=A0A9P7CZF3_9AGAM|nr:Cullin repeat-like-containing domain protein [Suillus placidus]
MDDDSAEIELLEQNLNKTHQISQRMTSILTNFDTRLVKLEKSILPLYNSTQKLKQRAHNIDRALLKIDEVASSQDGIAIEEGLVLRGPQPGQLEAYIDILEHLNAAIAFKSSDADSRDMARLIETGVKKLTQLYTKFVAQGSSGSPPVSGLAFMLTEFPPPLMSSLTPLVAFLRTLPLPSTHPSHPAASAILNMLKDAQRGYADMRSSWNRAETLDGVAAGKEFSIWIDNLLKVTEAEYTLLAELAPLSSNTLIALTYDTLLTPLLTLFTDTLSSLTSLIKRSLHKYTFHALSVFSALTMSQSRWESVLAKHGREGNESFPEFLADLKLAAVGKGGDLSVGLADITISTVQYLNHIPDVQDAVGSALSALGDGNWKMGDGKRVGKTPKSNSVELNEKVLIQHFVYDIMNTLIGSLTTLSRTQRRPPFGSVFLLNNVSHLVSHLILRPTNPNTPSLLSKPTTDFLTSSWRTAKAGYFDASFSPLMQALADDARDKTSGSGWKAAAKEKFTRFYDLLEEERSAVGEEVVKLVVPSLQRFMQKQKEKEFSKNIKLSPEEVESRIRNFYN